MEMRKLGLVEQLISSAKQKPQCGVASGAVLSTVFLVCLGALFVAEAWRTWGSRWGWPEKGNAFRQHLGGGKPRFPKCGLLAYGSGGVTIATDHLD